VFARCYRSLTSLTFASELLRLVRFVGAVRRLLSKRLPFQKVARTTENKVFLMIKSWVPEICSACIDHRLLEAQTAL
jgi:hypothetical protein